MQINSIKNPPPTNVDSVKLLYYSFGKERYDSIIASKDKLINNGNLSISNYFDLIIQSDSLNYQYYSEYAYRLTLAGRVSEALYYLDLGSSYEKNKSKYYFDRGLILSAAKSQSDRDSCYYYFGLAIKYDSLNPYYWAARSDFLSEDKRYIEAIADINKCIQLTKDELDYINQRGIYLVYIGDYKNALRDLTKFGALYEHNAEAYFAKAACYNNLKKYESALKYAQKSLVINPELSKAYLITAHAKFKLNDKKGAIQELEKGAALGNLECAKHLKSFEKDISL